MRINRGEVILFSNGEYSDFSYCGQVVFTKDCNLLEKIEEYKKSLSEDDFVSQSDFVTFLIAKEFCLPLECREIHLGSYGQIEL